MNEEQVETSVAAQRYSQCLECDRFRRFTKQCKECGCFMLVKVKVKRSSCPLGKW
jgi:primosomal protein N'